MATTKRAPRHVPDHFSGWARSSAQFDAKISVHENLIASIRIYASSWSYRKSETHFRKIHRPLSHPKIYEVDGRPRGTLNMDSAIDFDHSNQNHRLRGPALQELSNTYLPTVNWNWSTTDCLLHAPFSTLNRRTETKIQSYVLEYSTSWLAISTLASQITIRDLSKNIDSPENKSTVLAQDFSKENNYFILHINKNYEFQSQIRSWWFISSKYHHSASF